MTLKWLKDVIQITEYNFHVGCYVLKPSFSITEANIRKFSTFDCKTPLSLQVLEPTSINQNN